VFEWILKRIQERIRTRQYIMTLHAEEEMNADDLTIFDVERAVLTGRIRERQKDRKTREWKYRIAGRSISDAGINVVAKIGPTGKLVIITIYAN
jgi:hypothetical protein